VEMISIVTQIQGWTSLVVGNRWVQETKEKTKR